LLTCSHDRTGKISSHREHALSLLPPLYAWSNVLSLILLEFRNFQQEIQALS
jgi:hypothetical protein